MPPAWLTAEAVWPVTALSNLHRHPGRGHSAGSSRRDPLPPADRTAAEARPHHAPLSRISRQHPGKSRGHTVHPNLPFS
jgi:hypothetical protein